MFFSYALAAAQSHLTHRLWDGAELNGALRDGVCDPIVLAKRGADRDGVHHLAVDAHILDHQKLDGRLLLHARVVSAKSLKL